MGPEKRAGAFARCVEKTALERLHQMCPRIGIYYRRSSPIIPPSAHAEAQSVALDSLHVLILARWITPSDDFDKVSSSSESRQLLEPFLRDGLRSLSSPGYPAVRSHFLHQPYMTESVSCKSTTPPLCCAGRLHSSVTVIHNHTRGQSAPAISTRLQIDRQWGHDENLGNAVAPRKLG